MEIRACVLRLTLESCSYRCSFYQNFNLFGRLYGKLVLSNMFTYSVFKKFSVVVWWSSPMTPRRRHFLPMVIKIAMYLSFLLSMLLLIVLISGSIQFRPDAWIAKIYSMKSGEEEVRAKLKVHGHMKSIIKCYENSFESETVKRGKYWVLKNYVKAGHGKLKCHESITLTTHGDFKYFQYIPTLVQRYDYFIFDCS